MPGRRARWACCLCAALAAGCGPAPSSRPPGTGAEAAVRGFYEALVRRDWPRAYDALDADSKARCGREQFDALAEGYRRQMGFEPQEVRVRSCEEHGADAVAHVVFMGKVGAAERSFKDGAALRRGATGWGVVLPPGFGQGR